MGKEIDSFDSLIKKIKTLQKGSIIVISGFGGSGKSTLANKISDKISSNVVSGDDFYRNQQLVHYWSCYDYKTIIDSVILPYKSNQVISYQAYDWTNTKQIIMKKFDIKDYLILEGVGLFHEEILRYADYTIWIDFHIDKALQSGKYRDKVVYGVNNDVLWETIWKENDLECYKKYRPLDIADFIYKRH